jgi:hypothetical protein
MKLTEFTSNNMDEGLVEVEDGCWDYYSGLPNPKWYEETFSDATEDED